MVDGAHAFGQLDFKISDLDCDYYGTSLQHDRVPSFAPAEGKRNSLAFKALGMSSLSAPKAEWIVVTPEGLTTAGRLVRGAQGRWRNSMRC